MGLGIGLGLDVEEQVDRPADVGARGVVVHLVAHVGECLREAVVVEAEVERGLEAVERRATQVDPHVAPLGGLVVPDVVVVVEELVRVRG